MNPLGYVNIHWLREFMSGSDFAVNNWFRIQAGHRSSDWDWNFFDHRNLENSESVLDFYAHGLAVTFAELNKFQKHLVLDTLAVALCTDDEAVWQNGINIMRGWVYEQDIKLSNDPYKLFQIFYDLLSVSQGHSMSEFMQIAWRDDRNDTLSLYKHC